MCSRDATNGLQKNETFWHNREEKYWNCKIYETQKQGQARRERFLELAQRRIELEDQKKTDIRTAVRQKKTIRLAEELAEERTRRQNEPPQRGPSTSLLAKLEPLGGYETSSILSGPSPLVTRAQSARISAAYNRPKADFDEFRPPEKVYATGGGRDLWSQNSIVTNLGTNSTADYSGRQFRNSLRGYSTMTQKTVIHNDLKPWKAVPTTRLVKIFINIVSRRFTDSLCCVVSIHLRKAAKEVEHPQSEGSVARRWGFVYNPFLLLKELACLQFAENNLKTLNSKIFQVEES